MIPLFTKEIFEECKSREFLPLQCRNCKNTFYRSKHSITSYINPNRKECGDFCSQRCKADFSYKPQPFVICEECKKVFQKTRAEIKRTEHNFCCPRCAGIFSTKHKTKGIRKSKTEKYLINQIRKRFPDLKILDNDVTYINDELDILIPSLNIAFEINGIFHYQPIFGEKHLKNQKRIDDRKIQKCIRKGISLYIVNTSKQGVFSEETSKCYLDEIINTIKVAGGRDRI